MNVDSKRPIAWNASRHGPSWRFYLHCGSEETGSPGIVCIVCHQVLRCNGRGRAQVIWMLQDWTRSAYRENKNQNIFSKSYYCLLYKRTSKERRKGNPPTPSTLSLYTIRLPPLEPFSMLRCTIRILPHDLTHHSVIPYRNNHAISPDVATPLTTSLSY